MAAVRSAKRSTQLTRPAPLSVAPVVKLFDYSSLPFIFPDFLRDDERYAAAQRYWEVVFARARNAAPLPDEQVWRLHWHYNPVKNGESIFSAVCRERKLAIRVTQQPPTLTSNSFSWVVNILPEGRRNTISELAITCVPSRRTMKMVFPLLVSWLRGDTLSQEFDARYDV